MEPKNKLKSYISKIALRDVFIHIRVTKVMRSKLELRAKRAGMTISDFVRMIIESN